MNVTHTTISKNLRSSSSRNIAIVKRRVLQQRKVFEIQKSERKEKFESKYFSFVVLRSHNKQKILVKSDDILFAICSLKGDYRGITLESDGPVFAEVLSRFIFSNHSQTMNYHRMKP